MRKITVAMLLVCIMVSCKDQDKRGDNGWYETMRVVKNDKVMEQHYAATLQGRQFVEIRPQVSGTITKICIAEGANVHKGQTLFIIDQVPYKAAVETAQAAVQSSEAKAATARMTLEGKQLLLKENITSSFDFDLARHALAEAEAQCAEAKAQLVNARNNLSYTEVKSPVDGTASMIPYRVGALVGSTISEPLVTVSDDKEVYAYFSMTENQILALLEDYGSLQAAIDSMPNVGLTLSNGKPYAQSGRIDAVSGTVNTQTGSISLRAVFPNPNGMLRNGSTAQVVIPHTYDNLIVVPQNATFEIQNKVFCYRIQADTTATTPITVEAISNGKEYIVTKGLEEGDEIIASGAGLVREGVKINREKRP